MKAYGGLNVYIHVFLTLDYFEVSSQFQTNSVLAPKKEPAIDVRQEARWVPALVWIKRRWKNNIKIDLTETGCEGVGLLHLS
jgi:hypothetical protein